MLMRADNSANRRTTISKYFDEDDSLSTAIYAIGVTKGNKIGIVQAKKTIKMGIGSQILGTLPRAIATDIRASNIAPPYIHALWDCSIVD
jgi:hypothetical protein